MNGYSGLRSPTTGRVVADGKHLAIEGRPFRVRGVTYGSFRDRGDGALYPERERIAEDFKSIAGAGLNTVRVYTVPPEDVLDLAREQGLRVIVGLDYEDWRMEYSPGRRAHQRVLANGLAAVEEAVERAAGRPEVLAISVGNEVPGDIVRVHGIRRVSETLTALVAAVHEADPELLACYTNFPTTEYLDVDGQDLVCFNVFLERPDQLRRYLRHLQVAAGDRPVVLTELGLASSVHGEEAQAASLEWQLRLVDEAGCAGATVFAWTDEWYVADAPVDGWGFGLTDWERKPRAAFEVAERWAQRTLPELREEWPSVSVVVCAYNAAATIQECLASLTACDYPGLEVVLCDDGSTDATVELARQYPVRIVELAHGGLSAARNAGIEAASGDVVAFLDSDAACHPEWPYHLALSIEDDHIGGTGGPNLPVREAGFVERAVAASPGGPVEVLLSDDRAEHVPGCNMAFRRAALDEIGYFDPIYTAAGDDVDVCWKLLDLGYEIAFSPAAQVRHHRRASVTGYLRQQIGYGRAERVMASRHRHRFNRLGQARWAGFIYGGPRILRNMLRPVVYHGSMGTAPFQPIVGRRAEPGLASALALLPLAVPLAALAVLVPLSAWFLLAPGLALSLVAGVAAGTAAAVEPARGERRPSLFRGLVGFLHVAQPLARTWGRLRARPPEEAKNGRPFVWTGDRNAWLAALSRGLAGQKCHVRPSDAHEPWDLVVRRGILLRMHIATAVHWRWSPSRRLAVRPRLGPLAVAATLVALVGLAGWIYLLAASTIVLVAAVIEATGLVRAANRALAETTRTAASEAELEIEAVPRRRLRRPGDLDRAPETGFVRDPL